MVARFRCDCGRVWVEGAQSLGGFTYCVLAGGYLVFSVCVHAEVGAGR